jgi:phosphoserine phosphatase RsbU/P
MTDTTSRLLVSDAAGNEREIEIVQTPFTIGRQGDSDLVLLDNRISRRHAQIVRDSRGDLLEDLDSRHGTFVNGDRVKRCLLKDGDRIGLGVTDAYRLTYRTEEAKLSNLLDEIQKAPGSPAPRLQHLNLLLQVAQILQRAPALDEVLAAVVDSALQLFDAERGFLFLTEQGLEPRLRLARTRAGCLPEMRSSDLLLDVVRRVIETRREEVILSDVSGGLARDETAILSAEQHGVVALPLERLPLAELGGDTIRQERPELLGVLYIESRRRAAAITRLDRQALQTLAMESAMIIENARLIRVAREQERSRQEMSVARRIQESLLPGSLPQAGHFHIHALSTPCRTVGGDYYDFVQLPGNRFGITVADVSGKGLPAAMMSVMLQGAFAALAAADPPLDELFRRVNQFLCQRTPPEMYATLLYGILEPSGRFQFVNAGHASPIVLRTGGDVEVLSAPNFPVGMFENATFGASEAMLKPGEQILIYSDGLTESQNEAFELLGEDRVRQVLADCNSQNLGPEDICEKLLKAMENFVGSAPQADDVTMALLRFTGLEN